MLILNLFFLQSYFKSNMHCSNMLSVTNSHTRLEERHTCCLHLRVQPVQTPRCGVVQPGVCQRLEGGCVEHMRLYSASFTH